MFNLLCFVEIWDVEASPWRSSGAWIIFFGNVRTIPLLGSAAFFIGVKMFSASISVRGVATRGYSKDFMMVLCSPLHASSLFRCPTENKVAQSSALSRRAVTRSLLPGTLV